MITLTTDFGSKDWFVGVMKGVLLRINREVRIVDITHDVPPGDIRAGAFSLAASCRFFPKKTVHLVVVDPGVGSARKAIAVETKDYFFVGPDNGVLSWALRRETIKRMHRLENPTYFLMPVSQTFHGRDIFAPVAAQLARGVPIAKFGPRFGALAKMPWPEPKRIGKQLKGAIVYFDRFGNAITNLEGTYLPGKSDIELRGGKTVFPLKQFFHAVPPGKPVGYVGSTGLIELALNGRSAEKELRLKIGTPIAVRC